MTETQAPVCIPADPSHPAHARLWYRQLFVQVLIAIVLGAGLGHFLPETASSLKPLGDGFIRLIKMVIAPIIFCTVVAGIAGMQDRRQVGRVGIRAIVYFTVLSSIALALGLLMVNLLQPGAGMNIDPASIDARALSHLDSGHAPAASISEFLLGTIPASAVGAFAGNSILQVVVFAVLFGYALSYCGEQASRVLELIRQLTKVLFRIVSMIMKLAPVGAFGAMAFTIGSYGLASMLPLATLIGVFYLTCGLFIFGVLGLVARYSGFSLWRLLNYLRDELVLVFSTSSSEPAMPRLIAKLEHLGCAPPLVGLAVPTGYSFNLDGTSIYLTLAAVFIAQATNTPLDLGQQLTLLGVLLITSHGAAGVAGSGFVTLAATLTVMPVVPVAGLALILGIDHFMSEARALTNFIGNAVATIALARQEGELDQDQLTCVLEPVRR